MTRPHLSLLLACGIPATAPGADAPGTTPKPNVVFILADDLGYGDVGCYGGATPTPHIDRLAREGVRFTTFYANAPECTPTRTALLTGRYQHRVGGLECAIGIANVGRYSDAERLAAAHELGLPASEPSIAKLLKGAGYATAARGKWHLGYERKFFPDRHGFDSYFGPLGGGIDYFHHTEPDGTPMLYRDGEKVKRDGYITDLIAEEAAAYVRAQAGPYFLYVPFTAPHNPLQGPDDRRDRPLLGNNFQQQNVGPDVYAAMIRRLDDGIGRILKALDESGAAGRTLVIFTSDNGGTRRARTAPLTGNKGQTLEGGIRVPCVVRWPGVLPAGKSTDRVGITFDLTASIAKAAGATAPPTQPFDGIDLLQREAAKAPAADRELFWRFRRGDNTWRAVRDGSLKWVSRQTGGDRTDSLYDLAADVAEKRDLAAARPADAARLKARYERWEQEVRHAR